MVSQILIEIIRLLGMKDLIQYISENKNTNPNKVFIKTSDNNFTYKDIAFKMNNLSYNLYQPKQKQQYTGILLDDSPELILAFLATIKNSDIAILFSPNMDEELLIQKINSLNLSKLIFSDKYRNIITKTKIKSQKIVVGDCLDGEIDFYSLLKSSNPTNFRIPFLNIENPSVVIFTSGTNGNPKNVLLSHKSIIDNTFACQSIIQNEKGLNFLGFADFNNFISLILVLSLAICTSGSITIIKEKTADNILTEIKEKKIDVFVSVPKNLQELIKHKKNVNINNLKYTLSLSCPLDEKFIDLWENKFSTTLLQGYGLAESLIVSFNSKSDDTKPATMGRALPNCNMKIMNSLQIELPTGRIGELYIKSKSNLISYLNSDKNKIYKNKWLPTGDLVKKDHEGYYHYIDKKINIIHKNGFSIFPEDIENVIKKHPLVSNIHVMKLLGEKDDNIKFCIVSQPESQLKQKEIKEFANKQLPQYLQPEFIEMYSKFPQNYLGKILRNKFIHSH